MSLKLLVTKVKVVFRWWCW